jgi:hypothetical protein
MRCFAGVSALAEECGVSVATVKRWLIELTTAGVIARQRRRNTSTLTFLTDLSERYKSPKEAEERTSDPVNEGLTDEPLSRCCEVDVRGAARRKTLAVGPPKGGPFRDAATF